MVYIRLQWVAAVAAAMAVMATMVADKQLASTWMVMAMQVHMFQLGVGGVEDMVEESVEAVVVEESVEAVVGAWVLIMTVSAGLSHHISACLHLLCWSCSPVSVTVSVQVIGETLCFLCGPSVYTLRHSD
jgi:hypothetical protein